jgi:signal transduction histidine kinase/ActR/RegA family two-component response regulator
MAATGFFRFLRKRSKEEAVDGQRDRLSRAAFAHASEFMALLDQDGRVLAANPTAVLLAGGSEADVRGRLCWEAPWWASSATLGAEIRAAVKSAAAGDVVRLEAVLPDPGGSPRYFDMAIRAVQDTSPKNLLMVEGWDVTPLRRAEHETAVLAQRLHRKELLGSAGRLAGGVAHDFNNLLAAILGSIEVLRADSTFGPRAREALSIIQQAAETAAKLTVQLLAFGRPHAPGPWVIDPAAAVTRLEPLLRRVLGAESGVTLDVRVPQDAWPIRIDGDQLEQILVNLTANARDAMPAGGKLLVALDNVTLEAARVFQTMEASPGEYLRIVVRDTGVGMRDAVLEQIFEPFFTTKEVGKGTGLGLSVVYGIARQNDGYIEVSSRPGAGTELRLMFPRARMLPASQAAESAHPIGSREHIVLVEDQPAMRASARDFLEGLGYAVEAFPDGESALAAARTLPDLDVLIADVALPGCSGLEVADQLRSRWPALEVLLLSGHGDDGRAVDHPTGHTHFLTGPLAAPALAERVRAILDARASEEDPEDPEHSEHPTH